MTLVACMREAKQDSISMRLAVGRSSLSIPTDRNWIQSPITLALSATKSGDFSSRIKTPNIQCGFFESTASNSILSRVCISETANCTPLLSSLKLTTTVWTLEQLMVPNNRVEHADIVRSTRNERFTALADDGR